MNASWTGAHAPGRGLTWFVGGVVALVAAVVAVFLAVGFFVFAVLTALTLTVAGAVKRRAPQDHTLIEARRIGGHSWVAYGWAERR